MSRALASAVKYVVANAPSPASTIVRIGDGLYSFTAGL